MKFKYENEFTFRKEESERVLRKYPDRVPIICEQYSKSKNIAKIDKNKYLVPKDITVAQFIYIIRSRLKLPAEQALYLIIEGTIPSSTELVSSVYEIYKDKDGFLYIEYTNENTFG